MEATQAIRRPRLFYGWYIVALAFLAQFMSTGLQAYTFGVFMKPMIDELNWSRGGISLVQSIGTVANGLLAPFIGGILDRRGGRALMIFGALVSGASFAALSVMEEIWHLYLIRGLFITIGNLCVGNLVVNVAVSNWFIRKRGRAIAIAAMGVSFAGVALAPLSQFLIDSFGWRMAWVILGMLVWVMIILPTALFMRRRPEDMGLRPDGDTGSESVQRPLNAVQRAALMADVKWTRAEAMRTPTLWMIIVAFGLSGMGLGAMLMHIVPYVSDLGFSSAIAAGAISLQALASMSSKIVWGFLIERVQARMIAIASFSCAVAGLALLIGARSVEMVYLSLAIFGIGMGGQIPIQEVVWANYFGRITLGTIRSIGMPFMIISSAGGPFLAGVTYDLTKSYQFAFFFFICAYLLGIVLMLLLRPPKHPRTAASPVQG